MRSIIRCAPRLSVLDSNRDRGGDVLRDVRFRRRRLQANVALAFGLMYVTIVVGNTFQSLLLGAGHSSALLVGVDIGSVRWPLLAKCRFIALGCG